jgi:nicotinamidase-related amidase
LNSALIIIDVQNSIVSNTDSTLFDSARVIGNIAYLLDSARSSAIPVFFIQHTDNNRDGFITDSKGWMIHDSIRPQPGEIVIQKSISDSFYKTTLNEELKSRNIDRVFISGLRTELCVDTASRRAFSLGYDVYLVEDAHSTYENTTLKANQIIGHHNETLATAFVTLIKTKEFCGQLAKPPVK